MSLKWNKLNKNGSSSKPWGNPLLSITIFIPITKLRSLSNQFIQILICISIYFNCKLIYWQNLSYIELLNERTTTTKNNNHKNLIEDSINKLVYIKSILKMYIERWRWWRKESRDTELSFYNEMWLFIQRILASLLVKH